MIVTVDSNVLKWCHLCCFSNAEGEEYLRQRRRLLPFGFTTGEALLYDTGPTVDISQFQFNKMFTNGDWAEKVAPGSLLDSFLKQDETAYTNTSNSPLPVDQVFVNSWAMLSIPSDTWSENGAMSMTGVVKEEAKQSLMTVINNLENGDLCSVLQNLDVDDSELLQWENVLSRLSQSEDHYTGVGSQIESIFTSDIFDYMDSILFKGNGENLNGTHPSCLNHQQEPAARLCEPPLFPTPRPECTYSPHFQQQGTLCASIQTFNNTRKLSHLPLAMEAVPPQLTVPEASATLQSCRQMHVGRPPEVSQQSRQILSHPQTGLQSDGELLQSAVEQQLDDVFSPLVSCTDFRSSARNVPVPFSSECLKNSPPLQPCNRQLQEWQQSQHQMPLAAVEQNGHELMPACHSLMSESSGLWQNNIPKLTPGQQGGLAHSRAAPQSSCMFDQHFSYSPAGGDVTALSRSSTLRWADVYMDQSPRPGSCYFQRSHSEPVVGSSVISQEDVSVSPLSHPSTTPSEEHTFNTEPYLDCHRHIPVSHCGMQNSYKTNVKGANK